MNSGKIKEEHMKQSRFIFPLNIQLFAEGADSNVSEGVVTPQQEIQPTPEPQVEQGVNVEPIAEPQPTNEPVKQSQEENAKYAAARRKAEAEAKAIADEKARIEAENKQLLDALKGYGYEGSPQEIADRLEAARTGRDINEIRVEREMYEQQMLEKQRIEAELNELKNFKYSKLIEEDIATIKKAYPDANINSIEDLGQEYINIMRTGTVDSVTAYEILQARKAKTEVPKPPITGATNTSSTAEKDFFTSEEVDRLSEKDLDNPKIFETVRKSMLKWKN